MNSYVIAICLSLAVCASLATPLFAQVVPLKPADLTQANGWYAGSKTESVIDPYSGTQMNYILRYQLLAPANYDPTKSYPLIWVMQGQGSQGTDGYSQVAMAGSSQTTGRKIEYMIQNIHSASLPQYNAFLFVPQLLSTVGVPGYGDTWSPNGYVVPAGSQSSPSPGEKIGMDILADFKAGNVPSTWNGLQVNIDSSRQYLVGHSMGGEGVWDMILRYPKTFAAAAIEYSAMSMGIGSVYTLTSAQAQTLKNQPVWDFHAKHDPTVDVSHDGEPTNINLINAAAGHSQQATQYDQWGNPTYGATGGNSFYTEYDSTVGPLFGPYGTTPGPVANGHDICGYVESQPGFYSWMFGQALPEPGTLAVIGLGAAAMLRRRKRA